MTCIYQAESSSKVSVRGEDMRGDRIEGKSRLSVVCGIEKKTVRGKSSCMV